MHPQRILRRGLAAAVLVLLVATSAAAQQYGNGDDGQYQILQARYGTAERNVDVTQRLKELATQDRTFRMGNSTFGVDPDPGRVKTLRIYTRGPGGANRMFEYREGSVVDGSQFTGWGRGDWGQGGWNGGWGDGNGDDGQYQILQARYGTANRNVDVTQRLKELATQDRTFRMGNSTFGMDPDPGRVKTLRIYTHGPGGANRMFEYREGSVVDGSQFTGWGRGDWGHGGWNGGWGDGDGDEGQYQILQARYGTANRNVDVTQRLKELATQDRTFRMGNSTFGMDPDPGRVKTLRIYTHGPGGANRMFEYREGSVVDGSQFTGWGRGDWGHGGWNGGWGDGDGDDGQYQILQARYGTANRNVDVTQRLKELATQDRTFRMGNSTFGMDPDPGRVKTLRIYTRGPGGANRMFEYREGSVVDGSQFTGWGRGDWGHGGWNGGWGDGDGDEGQYQILQARYGTANRNVDVTQRLKELATQDRTFRMGNSTFGMDPDPGRVKTLRIYTHGPGGANRMFEYREGSVVDGSQFTGWGRGDWGHGGWDGGWGDGDRDDRGRRDHDRDGTWNGGDRNGRLNIVKATYGAGNRNQDVTGRLRSLIREGRLDITVNNDTLGTDPAPGSRKTLRVSYSAGGGSQQQTRVQEGGRVSIP